MQIRPTESQPATTFVVRRATIADVAKIRLLVNAAYQELADLGMNYTGSYQNEETTLERMQGAEVYLLESFGELIATVSVRVGPKYSDKSMHVESCLYISQLAVIPAKKRQGLGSRLLKICEEVARQRGLTLLQLDTAMPAVHLVRLYESHGFQTVDQVQWQGKSYRSFIMEKRLAPSTGYFDGLKFAIISDDQPLSP